MQQADFSSATAYLRRLSPPIDREAWGPLTVGELRLQGAFRWDLLTREWFVGIRSSDMPVRVDRYRPIEQLQCIDSQGFPYI